MTPCDDCALRLFNDKCYNLKGIGNPYLGRLIVVPNVDYQAYKGRSMDFSSQVDIIKKTIAHHNPSTGKGDNLDFYIVPFIRCNTTIGCEITTDIIQRCIKYLARDLVKYNFRDILLLGESTQLISHIGAIKDNLDKVYVTASGNNRKYFVNYNPLIKYIDDNKFETFEHYLIKWYQSVTHRYYDYEIQLI